MGKAKDIMVGLLSSRSASAFVKRVHYSGKVVQNSTIHFGATLDGRLGGVMSFGSSSDKTRMIGLVSGTKWNGFIELNRMAFLDWMPRNGESRALSFALRFLRKHYPEIEWVVTFADACQCGDGAIYRAAGFLLTAIKPNTRLFVTPSGEVLHKLTLDTRKGHAAGRYGVRPEGSRGLFGFMLRYVYFLNPEAKARLSVPIIPYDEIGKMGASMYRGLRATEGEAVWVEDADVDAYVGKGYVVVKAKQGYSFMMRAPVEGSSDQEEKGGSIPTRTLQTSVKNAKES